MYLAMSDSQSRIKNFKTLGPGSTKISRTHEYTLPISQLNPPFDTFGHFSNPNSSVNLQNNRIKLSDFYTKINSYFD